MALGIKALCILLVALLVGFLSIYDPVAKYVVPEYDLPPFLQTVTLEDGRKLAYAEHGSPNGFPIFVLQSFMQARVGHNPEHFDTDLKHNARIILVDRPGYGESDIAPFGYTSTQFAHELDYMAQKMGFNEYGLIGISAGAVYAMAAAHELCPKRLKVVVLLSPAPPDPIQGDPGQECVHQILDPLRHLGYHVPRATRLAMLVLRWWIFFWFPTLAFPPEQMVWAFTPTELSHFVNSGVWNTFCNATLEAFKKGVDGIVNDVNQISAHWAFQVSNLNAPNRTHNILIFHGHKDTIVPLGCARFYSERIRGVRKVILYEECGHGMMANVTVWNDVLEHINEYRLK